MEGLVIVKPLRKNIWGDFSVSGAIKGKDGKAIWQEDEQIVNGKTVVVPRTLQFVGTGFLLDMKEDEHQKLYKTITESKGAAPRFLPNPNGGKNSLQRFTIENVEDTAKKYLSSRERKAEVEAFIVNIAKDENALKRFGLCFGLKGTKEVLKANLYKMVDDDKQRPKLAELINNIDRPMIELIEVARLAGDQNTKKGLWKDGRNMFFWNELPLALGMNELIAYFKNEKNSDMYAAIKETHRKELGK